VCGEHRALQEGGSYHLIQQMPKHRVETASKPVAKSVSDYRDKMLSEAPNRKLADEVLEKDVQCTCCNQQAPSQAAAMLKVMDQTPITNQFQQSKGEVVWICADCYTFGVRPLYVKFGDITWNQEGKKVMKRSEKRSGHPW